MAKFVAILLAINVMHIARCQVIKDITLPCDQKQANVFCMGAIERRYSMAGEGNTVPPSSQVIFFL